MSGLDLEEIIINHVRETPTDDNIKLALMLVNAAQARADRLRRQLMDALDDVKKRTLNDS